MNDSDRRLETIAVVGAGQMGAAVGMRMRETGARVITTLKGRSAATIERAHRASLEVIDDEDRLVSEAAMILSIVPPGQAEAVAERLRAPLTRTPLKPVFAECNAVSPATVRRIAASLAATGCPFIDASIIGGPPPAGRVDQGPRFYASGADAIMLAGLRKYGLDIAIIDAPVGAASAFKMAYAGLTKGLIALGTATIGAASRDGFGAALRDEFARSQPELLTWLRARIPAMFPKAYRWVAEMDEIAEYLGDAASGATIYTGAARLYERVAASYEHGGDQEPSLAALKAFLAKPNHR
ncbi:MAG: DUF1932 domain-containing protein [Candidatus Binataceae bacterium]